MLSLNGVELRRCIIHYLPVLLSQFSSYQTLTYAAADPDPAKDPPSAQQGYDNAPSNAEYYDTQYWQEQEQGEAEVRPRIPLIVLAQQYGVTEVSEPGTPRVVRSTLSTITERTEHTEATPHWRSRHLNTPRPLSSTPTSSYGEIISPSYCVSLIRHHSSSSRS